MVLNLFFIIVVVYWIFTFFRAQASNIYRRVIDDESSDLRRFPKLSIIVPAKDEEESIEIAIRKIFKSDYPEIEVIAVNDRSEDQTGHLLSQLKVDFPNLKVVHIQSLPEGIMGKNHALQKGLEHASGDYVLFIDGDVKIKSGTLKKTMNRMIEERLDHLSIMPSIVVESYFEKVVNAGFFFNFSTGIDLWRANAPNSLVALGAGAFTLMKRTFLQKNHLLEKLKLEIIEDVGLAYLTKRLGGKSQIFDTIDHVKVRYQLGVVGLVKGTDKVLFSGVSFSYLMGLFVVLFGLLVSWGPWVFTFIHPNGLFALVAITFMQIKLFDQLIDWMPKSATFFYPVSSLIMLLGMIRSMGLFFKNNGVIWRNTHYRASDLKQGKVIQMPWNFKYYQKLKND